MSTDVDQLQENYYFANQQLKRIQRLCFEYLEIDKDCDLNNFHELYNTLENFFIGRSMLEHPSNFGAGGLKKDPNSEVK